MEGNCHFQIYVLASGHTRNISSPTGCITAAEQVGKPFLACVAETIGYQGWAVHVREKIYDIITQGSGEYLDI